MIWNDTEGGGRRGQKRQEEPREGEDRLYITAEICTCVMYLERESRERE